MVHGDFIQIFILLAILAQGLIALMAFRAQRRLENARATLSALHSLADSVNESAVKVYAHLAEGGFCFETSPKEEEINLLNYLDYLEDISVAVNMGIYDIDIVNRVMGTQLIRASDRFAYFIDEIRERQGSDSFYKELRLLGRKLSWLREVRPSHQYLEVGQQEFLADYIRTSNSWVSPKGTMS
ncbi:MAG: DUF4760 domain-containing protein [Pseudomonadota bacterium]